MNTKGNTYVVHDALNVKLLTKIKRKPSYAKLHNSWLKFVPTRGHVDLYVYHTTC